MKRAAVTATLVSTTLALLLAASAHAAVEGGWNASRQKSEAGTLQFNVSYGHSNHGEAMRIADFNGLSAAHPPSVRL